MGKNHNESAAAVKIYTADIDLYITLAINIGRSDSDLKNTYPKYNLYIENRLTK